MASSVSEPVALEADLARADHAQATLALMNAYAADPMGASCPLEPDVARTLVPWLRTHPTTLVFLAFRGDEPVGIAVCFLGFSTFAARLLLNISDYYVVPALRGQGVGRLLMQKVEAKARELRCCKLTLEVQEHNHRALAVYARAGFTRSLHVEAAGEALYLVKPLRQAPR
jgi:GNAT superfamily N-acetyltransferase